MVWVALKVAGTELKFATQGFSLQFLQYVLTAIIIFFIFARIFFKISKEVFFHPVCMINGLLFLVKGRGRMRK